MAIITNLEDYRNNQSATAREKAFCESALNLIEDSNYTTNSLKQLLSVSTKIVYFSGGLEQNEHREVNICDQMQLLRAASMQRFTFEMIGEVARLSFDDEYFYDVYFKDYISTDLKSGLLKTLDLECEINWLKFQIQKQKFKAGMNELLT
jgi:hypothetical protein